MPLPLLPCPARPLLQRYDAELLSRRRIDGPGFRIESETRNVAGRRDFDFLRGQHVLTLTPDGRPMQIEARIDGRPEQSVKRPGVLTLLPAGRRFRGYSQGVGVRGEVLLLLEPALVAQASGVDIEPSRLGLVRSLALRNPLILEAIAELGREVEESGLMGRVYTESLVVLTLTELVRHHSTLATVPKRAEDLASRRLRRLIDYIEAHLGEDLSLLTLAAEVGVSPAHLAQGFKRAMGRSVHQYLLGRRVEWAAALLGATEQPISEIALETGFSSQSHLTTAFQRLYRTTPAAHRRQRRR